MRTDGSIDGFAVLLKQAGLELGAEEMADALWLARHISPKVTEQVTEEEVIKEQPAYSTAQEELLNSELENDEEDAQLPLSLPPKQDSGSVKPDGIPIKTPAAPALRIRLELAQALRPLRRRVPSPVRMEFDQAATIDRIADQAIWSPVLSPAPERWLEVALVIEESKSAPLWKETLAEFQTLLERQGAFRSVSPWRLRSDEIGELILLSGQSSRPRSARELLDPAGRRLILVVSDCTSIAWQRETIYSWLEIWGDQAPMTVIQLLPERLWAQTGLAHGTPMWLSALEPGVPSARMMATTQMPLWDLFRSEQSQVIVPVVSLEAEPLKQWANVVIGTGESRTVGFRFERRENPRNSIRESEERSEMSAEERVRLFRASASLTAQKLAGLMSAAPVSSPIVNLIRQTMLTEAESTHVAEVYMGGLIKNQFEDEYDFFPEVRNILLDGISIKDTEQVLNTTSDYISKRLNLNIRSFEALLSIDPEGDTEAEKMIVPFAMVATQALQRMGQEYSAIVERVQQTQTKVALHSIEENSSDWIPLLNTFIFQEATVSFEQNLKTSSTSATAQSHREDRLPTEESDDYFYLKNLETKRTSDRNESWANVTICDREGKSTYVNSSGKTPVGATLVALDEAIDKFGLELPQRELINFSIPPIISSSSDSSAEVKLTVECAEQKFIGIAHSNSVYYACAQAYINAVNRIIVELGYADSNEETSQILLP